MRTLQRVLLLLALVLSCSGCSAAAWSTAISTLVDVAQGADYVASVVDVAEDKARRYFDRHPNHEREAEVRDALEGVRDALAALRHAIAAAEAGEAGDIEAARASALAAYERLRATLESHGVLGAVPPEGGAETSAPAPAPFDMPARAELEPLI